MFTDTYQVKVKVSPIISHEVKPFVRDKVGILEGEPVALMVHFTKGPIGYDVYKDGFVNVSGRGTLAPITENDLDGSKSSVPGIMENFVAINQENVTMLIFCVPAGLLKMDTNGNYGYWYDNPLADGTCPELHDVYSRIVTQYDDETGQPLKYAKDDPGLYPVVIPKQYIYDVIYPTAYKGKRAGDK